MRVILALLMVVGALQQRAEACSCRVDPFFPPATGVPLNARLRVLDRGGNSFTLRTQDGTTVPSSSGLISSGVLVTPAEFLAPETDYVLTDEEGRFTSSFRTTRTVDEVAPPVPVLGTVTHFVSPVLFRSTCDTGGETFSIPLPTTDGVYELFVGTTVDTIDTTQPAMTLPGNFGFVALGDASLCGSNFPVSTTASLAIAIREVDLAGNASSLSEPIQLKGGGGCSATGGPTLLLLAGLLAGIRAKSRRKRAVS